MARILLVDDEPVNLELLHAFLDHLGHELVDADSGEQAIAEAGRVLPDLAVLDVIMPGMNGFEAAIRLKELADTRRLPIIMLSSLDDHPAAIRGERVVADAFMPKPFDRGTLIARIAELLRG